ncbi:hypothetical protein ACQP2P_30180 [Dactylosporangium sp. CA-139114]|uniref:hypothetical protein n=1 Tax=Dactylosporangium sp. CA-139114 TaxID=3239931 RepID=UPI003D993944
MRRSGSETREHLLQAAHDLFYWRGIRATGVDMVAEVEPVDDPDALADRLALIAEGMNASVQALGIDGPVRQARAMAELLLDAATTRDAARRPAQPSRSGS